MDDVHNPRHSSLFRSSNGCWTCRLRRKKCDENTPVCNICASLFITCHYSQDKPEWMDGGSKQETMAKQLKREVRDNAHRRLRDRPTSIHVDQTVIFPPNPGEREASLGNPDERSTILTANDTIRAGQDVNGDTPSSDQSSPAWLTKGSECGLITKGASKVPGLGRRDTVFLMFYLEHLFPSLFPFYRPSVHEGGRSWILEMMFSSPVLRRATLCQSSYFFSLARGTVSSDVAWDIVLSQTQEAYEMLRESLQFLGGSDISEHLHGAVRIMTSIMQVQRFEIAILSFDNCKAHLNATLALFEQLLDSTNPDGAMTPSSRFAAVMSRLGPCSSIIPAAGVQIPSAEQSAFRFSTSLLILDDIIASVVLQERPRLYDYHRSLLVSSDGSEPFINLEAVVGCQGWVLVQIGELAALDAWKKQCKEAGNLDIMELVRHAKEIKDSLESHLQQLECGSAYPNSRESSLLDVFAPDYCQQTTTSTSSLVTRVWAHAALLYLLVVVSGWQPACVEVRNNVGCIINLLTHQPLPAALLRTMVWPFCVAGCLAESAQEDKLRQIAAAMQPLRIFGTAVKALTMMESVWSTRDERNTPDRDLASCFKSHGDLVLLV